LGAINIPGQPETVTTTPLDGPIELERLLTLPAHSITVLDLQLK
jgi:hypothetical protein